MFQRRLPRRWYLPRRTDDVMKMTSPGSWSHLSPFVSQVILGFVPKADYKVIAKAIRHRVTAIKRERDKKRRLLEEAHSNQKEATSENRADSAPQQSELSNKKPESVSNMAAAGKAASQVRPELLIRQRLFCFFVLLIFSHVAV